MGRPVQYGGQAVIEGVMMRGPRESAIAVRLPNGEIEVTRLEINAWARGKKQFQGVEKTFYPHYGCRMLQPCHINVSFVLHKNS